VVRGQDATGALAKAPLPKGRPLTASQQIIYTATLRVRVADVRAASSHGESIVDGSGGYLFSQDANLTDRADATLVFKVPPDQFDPILGRLGALGTPLAKNVNASDVTDQVVDLEGRLKTASASATRLRALLGNAANVPDIVAIENDLATRESQVETLQGQLRVVQNRVQLATVTLELTTTAPHKKANIPGFTKALSAGWTAFAGTGKVVLAAVGAALPFALFVGCAGGVVALVRRKRRSAPVLTP
jgi:hypothetical protein